MNVAGLLDYIQEELEKASTVPLSGKSVVDKEKLLNLVESVRQSLPVELQEAENVMAEKNTILYDAEKEAEAIIADANLKAKGLVEETEITQTAYRRAEEILTNAQNSAREIRKSANEYVEDILQDLESYVSRSLEIVRQNREQMRGR